MELKTLKDLIETFGNSTSGFDFINPNKARQNAIKWIKSADMSTNEALDIWQPFNKHNDLIKSMHCISAWIRHQYNITDEDLNG